MSDTDIMPAPDFPPLSVPSSDSKWAQERAAFNRLLPSLLATYAGKYVAIHQGQVVELGDDQIDVAVRAYDKVGYTPIYVGLVSTGPPAPAPLRMPSPRIHSVSE